MTSSDRLDATFAALADPTRRAILTHLSSNEVAVAKLAVLLGLTQTAISKHLKVLERADMISLARDTQRMSCRRKRRPIKEARRWLDACETVVDESPIGGRRAKIAPKERPPPDVQRLDALIDELRAPPKKLKG